MWSECDYRHGVDLDEFAGNFCVEEEYLRRELDQTFEICHHHSESGQWSTGTADQAEFYTNYAAFLQDVLKHYDEAARWNVKALKLSPEDTTINWNLAELYKDTKQYKKAIKYYDLTLQHTEPGVERDEYEVKVGNRKRFIEEQRDKKKTSPGSNKSKETEVTMDDSDSDTEDEDVDINSNTNRPRGRKE